uniref:Gametocyte-specific factor 1 n=1 Tax=Lygus hesperus TaxID=30085 RepID=A0A146KZI9_LYGHE
MIDPGEPTVVCPYNRAHAIIKSRMQFHLPKCRAQHPNMEKAVCPYNSTHVFNYVEMNYHKENCTDKRVVDSFVYHVGNFTPPAGLQPVLNFEVQNNQEDDWDANKPPVSVLDDVRNGIHEKGVLVSLIGAPKAERKAHRFHERLRYQHVVCGDPRLNNPPPRAEDKPPQSSKQMNEESEDEEPEQHPANNQPPPSGDVQPSPSAVEVDERNANASDFPTLSEKMSDMSVSNNPNQLNEAQPVAPPPSAWGKPKARTVDEKISWPTASTRAPTNLGFGSNASGRNAVQPPARQALPVRMPSNPWGTNTVRHAEPSNHLASAPQPRAAPPAATGGNPNPTVSGIWGRGKVFSSGEARMTSEDFPTLLPVSSRGRKPRP